MAALKLNTLIITTHPPTSTLTPPLTPSSPPHSHPIYSTPALPPSNLLTTPLGPLLGTGAWSNVYALPTTTTTDLIALKTPSHHAARSVIEAEAQILSYISTHQPRIPGLATFHGFDPLSASIYTELIPDGTLEDFVETAAGGNSNGGIKGGHIRAPTVGLPQWLFLAEKLMATMAGLKRAGVVHGDIKTGNMLLREWTGKGDQYDEVWSSYIAAGNKLYEPILVDFSSSHILHPWTVPEPVSAVTTSFAAPELLDGFLGRGIGPVPTVASDLYSAALCLLAAAVGSEVYANAGKFVSIYVRQGNPMGWVKAGDRGVKVGKAGAVAQVLEGCFGKTAEGRTGVEEVAVRVEAWKRKWLKEGNGSGDARWGC